MALKVSVETCHWQQYSRLSGPLHRLNHVTLQFSRGHSFGELTVIHSMFTMLLTFQFNKLSEMRQ